MITRVSQHSFHRKRMNLLRKDGSRKNPMPGSIPILAVPPIFSLPISSYLSNTSAGIMVTDDQHQLIWLNEVVLKNTPPQDLANLLYLPFDAVVRHYCVQVAQPVAFAARMQDLVHHKKPYIGWEIAFRNGRYRELSYIPIFDAGVFVGSIWEVIDITKHHTVQQEIQRNEEKFQVVLDNLNAALCETDLNGNITKAYDGFCRMSGMEEEQLIGKNLIDLFVPEEKRPYARLLRQRRLDKNMPLLYEMEIETPHAGRRWVLASATSIRNQDQVATGSMSIYMDITPQKRLQRALEQSREAAEQARQAQREFLANISHEIRNPLTAIIGMSHLLENTPLTAEQREYVGILKLSSDFLLELVGNLLDLSKIEAGKQEVQQREFHLVALLKSLLDIFRLKMGKKPVVLTLEVDPSLRNWLIGDDLLLKQILLNLLTNAEKFTSEGEIAIKVRPEGVSENKLWLTFRVCDTGIGLDQEQWNAVFEDYRQAVRNTSERYGGTGLGLAIVKQLVELQGGRIFVEELPLYRTCFCFTLPYTDTGRSADQRRMAAQGDTYPAPIPAVRFEEAYVLVVEDNMMNRKYISGLLNRAGLRFQLATNGQDALHLLQHRQFDLILMDLRMPGVDGYELAARVRADEMLPNAATPIVAVTASAVEDTADQARLAGINDVLSKPYTPDQLIRILQKFLNEDETALMETPNTNGYQFQSALDTKFLDALYENNLGYASDLFEVFVKTIHEEMAKIKTLLEEKDWEGMGFQVHKLKPNFSMVGLTAIAANMQTLENYLKSNQLNKHLPEIPGLFAEVESALAANMPVVEEELKKMRAFEENGHQHP
ncbi:PAS domain S-box protein [Chitinophaga costaii]|nr:PAS domain S-box protein [Chitinophaga costaii]